MRRLKRLLAFISLPFLCACTESSSTSSTSQTSQEPTVREASRVVVTDTRNYLEVDGHPFRYNGVQIRVDWLMDVQGESVDDLDIYFQRAEELGVNCVELPITWKSIEPRKDAYSFRNVNKLLTMAKNHNLKVELLLFGVNIGGMTGNAPDYVKSDKATYEQYRNTLNHPDALFFKQDDPDTLGREKLAAAALMDAVFTWSENNSSNTVIGVQIRNEPDLYETRRVENTLLKADGNPLTAEEARAESLYAIDEIAKVVKASSYKCMTRINVCCYSRHPEESWDNWRDIVALDSIDLVGEDTYNASIAFNKDILSRMNNIVKPYGGFAQIAENTGGYENGGSLILMADAIGGSYLLYDLITPSVITDSWGYYDWGILDNDTKQGKAAFPKVKSTLEGINKSGGLFQTTATKDIALFNVDANSPWAETVQTVNTTKARFTFSTTSGALGYGIVKDGYAYLWSDKVATVRVTEASIAQTAERGYLRDNGSFVTEGSDSITSDTISLLGGELYRVAITHEAALISDTVDQIGIN